MNCKCNDNEICDKCAGMPPIRVLNMGAGVQTTAILLEYHKKYDYVVFADTGDEKPETYYYIENFLKPFCKKVGLEWVTVKAKTSLMEHCNNRKIFPIVTRRWCTEDFKIKPIQRFLRKELKASKTNPVICDIGISLDESHRARFDSGNKYQIMEYPLLDAKITRKQCYEIIKKHGFPVPPKSGCYYCPYMKRHEFRKLSQEHPDLFKKALDMEEASEQYTVRGFTLNKNYPLRSILDNTVLDNFFEEEIGDTCDSGHCFV